MNKTLHIITTTTAMILAITMVAATCTEQETQLFANCYGITFFDQYYLDWCYQYDYNTDGIIDSIDATTFSNSCNEPEPTGCSQATIDMYVAAFQAQDPSADLNGDGLINLIDAGLFNQLCIN